MVKALEKNLIRLLPIVAKYHSSYNRLILIDYDGTLVPYASRPQQAKPSKRVLHVITALAKDTHNTVVVISGRNRDTLDTWLGNLSIKLIAEHGAFEKRSGIWKGIVKKHPAWKEKVLNIMHPYVKTVLGSQIEEKETAVVYHYRNAISQAEARGAVNAILQELKKFHNLETKIHITNADMALEVRQAEIDKGKAAISALLHRKYDFVMCAGDSETDEDMFIMLEQKAFCIKVGPGKTAAKYHIATPRSFINFLAMLTGSISN